MKRKFFISSWLIIGLTLPLLAILAFNQFHWLQDLTLREQKRICSNMLMDAAGVSHEFMDELLLLPAMLEIGIDGSADPQSSSFGQYRAWTERAKVPEILRNAYLTVGGEHIAFSHGDERARPVTEAEVPKNGARFPFSEGQDTFTLWFPKKRSKAGDCALVCVFDKKAIFTRLIPAIARDSLKAQDQYLYRIIDLRDGSVLFASEGDYAPRAFDTPDCKMALLRENAPPREPELRGKESFFPYLEIQIVNKQKTLAEMTMRSTVHNAFASFGIFALLAMAMGILAMASSKARQIANKQQEFIATVTHELKTPLAVIVSAAQNLADGLVRDQGRIERYGNAIAKEATRLSVSIEHFLLYANTGTQGSMTPVPCDVGEVIENALALTRQECADTGVTVDVSLPDEPILVDGDPVALESVVRNLAENALRHAHDGKILHILVEEEVERDSSRRYAVIKVQDHGPGISKKEQRLIFDPFVRGKSARSGQVPGNGIGLNLVRRIVAAHGGSVAVESKLGQGSTFIVKLPQGGGDSDGNQNSDDRG